MCGHAGPPDIAWASAARERFMKPSDDGIRIRPGRVRSRGDTSSKRFVSQVLRAAEKAGGVARRVASSPRSSTFGRGRSASLRAARELHARTRHVTVKARVVRHSTRAAPLATHVAYLQRDGVTKDGAPGRVFDAEHDEADGRAFAERSADDRHHFRFIVSPENAAEMTNLQAFTRDLMTTAEQDLDTRLEWVAVEHHNTEHPHVHVLVRGRTDDGSDLVISRDYIREGMRARAQTLVTIELGPRTDLEIRRGLEAQVDADRWTPLDRGLARDAADNDGVVDLRPVAALRPDSPHHARLGRMQKLEQLGLATPAGPAQWTLSPDAETSLRALGDRGDIIKRLHKTMGARSPSDWVIAGERAERPIIGKLVARGLDDELKGTAYAIVDGVDGRAHHLRLPDLDATSDAAPGAIVEMRRFTDAGGRERLALAVRSDLSVDAQATAQGATWLDRRLIAREATALSASGFGGEVRAAVDRRTEYLIGEGLARRQGQRVLFARDLLDTLRQRELMAAGERLAAITGLPARTAKEVEHVAGIYRQRVTLGSGRFAMIDDGLGFSLVPWTPTLDRHLGRQVTGMATASGVDWSFGKKRGLGVG
jgi:type IV secretory pathway VirD2 relaxase